MSRRLAAAYNWFDERTAIRSLLRWYRQAHGEAPLTFWLIGGAVTVVFLFIVLGTAGVLYGFIRYGAS